MNKLDIIAAIEEHTTEAADILNVNWNKNTAHAMLACEVENPHYTHGVLAAIGHPVLGASIKYRRQSLARAERAYRATLEDWNPETFEDLMNPPESPEINEAHAAVMEEAADFDSTWKQVEQMRDEARRWLESNCQYDGGIS